MLEKFFRPHICLSLSVYGSFYYNLGFGREGFGFESGSCFVGLWGVFFVFFWGGGLGGGGGFTLILGGLSFY